MNKIDLNTLAPAQSFIYRLHGQQGLHTGYESRKSPSGKFFHVGDQRWVAVGEIEIVELFPAPKDENAKVASSEPESLCAVQAPIREVNSHKVNGCNETLQIIATDFPGSGGANHDYVIHLLADPTPGTPKITGERWSYHLNFQNGPIKEAGVNGITHEALLAIVADRLESFQKGPFGCDENAAALLHVQDALAALKLRTEKRLARNVEGTIQP